MIVGDTLNLKNAFGDIKYKREGISIAGGAGITPFLAILKDPENSVGNNKLFFANSTAWILSKIYNLQIY